MQASVMFVDCPAYMSSNSPVRCGLPAEVEGRYTMQSTDGPLESAKIRCPRGHWFNGPVKFLALPRQSHGPGRCRRPAARRQSASPAGPDAGLK
jgi:hypothetical protein